MHHREADSLLRTEKQKGVRVIPLHLTRDFGGAKLADYIGAIDQGTTSTRFIVFDRSGRTVAVSQKEHEQIYPKPGWVEHNAEEIWRNTRAVIAEAMVNNRRRITPSPPPSAAPSFHIPDIRRWCCRSGCSRN